jgi:hypothetical protein
VTQKVAKITKSHNCECWPTNRNLERASACLRKNNFILETAHSWRIVFVNFATFCAYDSFPLVRAIRHDDGRSPA